MKPDQNAQGGSLIWVHFFCNIGYQREEQMTYFVTGQLKDKQGSDFSSFTLTV